MKFHPASEVKSSTFIPETKGNIEILTYLGSTGHAKDRSRQNEEMSRGDADDTSNKWEETFELYESQFSENTESSLDQSSLGPGSHQPMSRWENRSNLAGSP